jgi:hypothetical protein
VGVGVENNGVDTNEVVRALRAAMQKPLPAAAKTTVAPKTIAVEAPVVPPLSHAIPQKKRLGLNRYVLSFMLATLGGLCGIVYGNKSYGPEMYGDSGMVAAAEASTAGKNYAVFDLNLNIRALRDEQLKRMTKTPEVILLGASHWQEAHMGLIKGFDAFNAHIHRDYWEDPLGMVELLDRHNKLPKRLIISIRDNQFKPVETRKDFLWEPGIPAYQVMAAKLGLPTPDLWKKQPYDRARALVSLPMLFENLTRWHNAKERPEVTTKTSYETLDVLLPDGSIIWSNQRKKLFTQERTLAESISFAESKRNDPPQIDPQGLEAFNTLLKFLKSKGVQVYLVHPPFNPMYYDRLQGTPYSEGLERFEGVVQQIAKDHNLPLFGSFNPHQLGCTAEMYIDAEHSNATCLQKVFDQFAEIVSREGGK